MRSSTRNVIPGHGETGGTMNDDRKSAVSVTRRRRFGGRPKIDVVGLTIDLAVATAFLLVLAKATGDPRDEPA
ncbi:hypothetical protein [Amycolatopsis sp. NPDC004169]|uniref:hypothetical protein n=1 Tax=Amycolatopsis sp. NPDC004169 TaxID=3154453 RepID=UPI0033BCC70E